ncbi:hypothetical protein [Nonomuraea sp. NPDC049750]|uniref:hypothetical protein n=1 Tax=Nonomuraea sp. NPDC049750 TaxID=3154738 RepID=UPI0033CE9E44
MRTLASLATVGLLAAALALPSGPAAADTCIPIHCYGIVEYHEPAFDAVGQELWSDCLVLNPNQGFATHEMWLLFSGGQWMEGGYVKGGIAGGDTQTGYRWFWADYDGTTFSSHFIAAGSILNYINLSMYRNSSGTWSVYRNGTLAGTTTSTYGTSTIIQTGGETTHPTHLSHGKSRYLTSRSASTGQWSLAQWDAVGATAGVYSVNHNDWERMEQISLQNICNPLPGGPPGTFAPLAPAKSPSAADIKQLAVRFAEQNGGKSSQVVEMVTTKRRAAQGHLKSGAVDSDQDVYVVQMKGAFTGHMVPRPKGAPAPKGGAITLTIDSATGEVTDWSLGKPADLKRLGSVKAL